MPTKFDPPEPVVRVMTQMWSQNVRAEDIAKYAGVQTHLISSFVRRNRDRFPKRDHIAVLPMRNFDCPECGKPVETRWARKQMCDGCAYEKRADLQSRSASSFSATRSEAVEWLKNNAGKQQTRLTDVFQEPKFEWVVAFKIPYSQNASKNRRWKVNPNGAVYMHQKIKSFEAEVQDATLRALEGRTLANNKVWLSFYVEKPDHKSDAVNIIDTMCDAIKKAVGVDDRWFSIRQLDWCIKKTSPNIIVAIAQESLEDVIACSHCGELKAKTEFSKNKGSLHGHGRSCKPCASVMGRMARERRTQVKSLGDTA